MNSRLSLKDIEEAVRELTPAEQAKLLSELPSLLHTPRDDKDLLKIAESSFEFWDNPEDAVYDDL